MDAVKNTVSCVLHANACQLWCKYTQTGVKRLRVAYNITHRILYYMPRNASIRPYEVTYFVRTFDA